LIEKQRLSYRKLKKNNHQGETMENKKKCLIIDGNNLIHRSYHASQKLIWLGENKEMYIFLKIFISLIKKENYEKLFIVFDKNKKTFRNEMNSEYKKNRKKTPDSLIKHLGEVQKLINEINLEYLVCENFEADDLIASFIKKFANNAEFDFHIFSQDKDLFQLLSKNVKILRYKENKLELFGSEEFLILFNFSHINFKYYLALVGDKVDNIKGIDGIGKKRANYIVSTYENLENTFFNINSLPKELKVLIENERKEIEKNIEIISLVENIDLKDWKNYDFSKRSLIENHKLVNFCEKRNLRNTLSSLISGTQNRTRTDTE
jgi:DNA polymerase I